MAAREQYRANITFTSKSLLAMAALQAETGMNKTDLTNRAIQLYAYIAAQVEAGKRFAIMETDDTVQVITFL